MRRISKIREKQNDGCDAIESLIFEMFGEHLNTSPYGNITVVRMFSHEGSNFDQQTSLHHYLKLRTRAAIRYYIARDVKAKLMFLIPPCLHINVKNLLFYNNV